MNIDGVINLTTAIVKKAVSDYRAALIAENKIEIHWIERFFLSEWGELMTYGNGQLIIDRVKNEVYTSRRKKRYLKRSDTE